MAEVKKEDVELLTSFTNGKAIGKQGHDFYIVSDISDSVPKKLDIWSERDLKATNFEKGVAIATYQVDTQYDKRYPEEWETYGRMITPSGYTIPLTRDYGKLDLNSAKNQELIQYARSIFENPAELLKIDKKLKFASADIIKAYVDIAKSGLEESLAKAGSEFSRTEVYGSGLSVKERQKLTAKYQKTLDLLDDLSKKITAKFHKLKENLEKEQAKKPRNRAESVRAHINSILDEPQQRGQ